MKHLPLSSFSKYTIRLYPERRHFKVYLIVSKLQHHNEFAQYEMISSNPSSEASPLDISGTLTQVSYIPLLEISGSNLLESWYYYSHSEDCHENKLAV